MRRRCAVGNEVAWGVLPLLFQQGLMCSLMTLSTSYMAVESNWLLYPCTPIDIVFCSC